MAKNPFIAKAKNKVYKIFDYFYFGIKGCFITKKDTTETLVFICETNVPRLGRLLKYLHRIRHERFVVFVHKDKFYNTFKQGSSSIVFMTYRSRPHLKYLVKTFSNIKLIHGSESRSVYPSVAAYFKNIPFVFDYQDLYINYFGKHPKIKWVKTNLKYEKICLESADHILSYSLEYHPARKAFGIPRKPTTYFPFYLDDETIVYKDKKELGKEIHIVYVGGITSCQAKDSFNLSLLKEQISQSNIFLHIYPSPMIPDYIIKEYQDLSAANPNFILHPTINQTELSNEISKYDFGFIPFYKVEGFLSDLKFKYSTTLKLFNYLEAGLPAIVMNYTAYQAWLVNHYQIGISMEYEDFNDFETNIRSRDYQELKRKVKQYQDSNLLSVHVRKISKIYDRLIQLR